MKHLNKLAIFGATKVRPTNFYNKFKVYLRQTTTTSESLIFEVLLNSFLIPWESYILLRRCSDFWDHAKHEGPIKSAQSVCAPVCSQFFSETVY